MQLLQISSLLTYFNSGQQTAPFNVFREIFGVTLTLITKNFVVLKCYQPVFVFLLFQFTFVQSYEETLHFWFHAELFSVTNGERDVIFISSVDYLRMRRGRF